MKDQRNALIWTSERTPLVLPLAGLGERALGYLIDLSLLLLCIALALFLYSIKGDVLLDWVALPRILQVLLIAFVVLSFLAYDVFFETLFDGQTPGKKIARLRVVRADGTRPDFITALLRNLLRIVDFLPNFYGVGAITLFATGSKRVGDILADTFVVTERAREDQALEDAIALSSGNALEHAPAWSDDDILKVLASLSNLRHLGENLQQKLAARTLKSVSRQNVENLNVDNPVETLADGIVALQKVPGSPIAHRVRLRDLIQKLDEAKRDLKKAPSKENAEILDESVRRLASASMRAQRKNIGGFALQNVALRLMDVERFKRQKESRRSLVTYFAQSIPQAVYQERKNIFRAAAVMAIGFFVGFLLSQIDPQFARYLLGPELAANVEGGANWTNKIEANEAFANAAFSIITNNVRVALVAFALGVFGGIFPLFAMGYNGLHIGSTLGYAASLGSASTLSRFILAHGPVELSAICIAGAGGICLGRALISPGDRPRFEALRLEGDIGFRLALFSAFALLVIGCVEGFVSPGQYFPMAFNAMLGATLWLLFFLWVVLFGRAKKSEN